jgi:galactokinase
VWTNYVERVINQLKLKVLSLKVSTVYLAVIFLWVLVCHHLQLWNVAFIWTKRTFNLNIKPVDIALMGQSAEHWVGINCGIMDQFSSVMGLENKVIKIDCKTLEYEYHNADFNDYSLILFDSNVKHSLMTSAYNEREQCEEGIAIVKIIFRDN